MILQNNVNKSLKAKVAFTIFIQILVFSALNAQIIDSTAQDSAVVENPLLRDILKSDSLSVANDSVTTETFQLSQDSLDAPVNYSANDSMIYDIKGQKIHLFGSAQVSYQSIKLNASHIIFDWQTNVVTAKGMPDSTGALAGFPVFQDGDQEFTAERMRYNFQTKKGVIYEVTTQQNDVVVKGSKSKFVSGEQIEGDTSEVNDYVYSADALFTTCTHSEPHYGIRSRKQKVIPNKLVVVGPSNLELMGVPTPLWLPFGFFPITTGRRTGLIFPRDYEYSQQWGFGLREVGWFFPLGEHFNLTLTANIYLKGTWGVNARSNYRKRYKYNGSFNLGYDSRRSEATDGTVTKNNSLIFQWQHRQDRSAHPTNNFGGSINIQTNGYQSNVFNDERVLNNQLRSNLTFSKVWQDQPFNLNVAFSHNQNTATQKINITFPSVQFRTQALYPFKREAGSGGGKEKWYERITFRYSGEASNRFEATDSTLFTQQTIDDAQYGMRHDVMGGTSFKILKYFNLNPSITYKETWYLRSLERQFTPGLEIDTLENNGLITYDTTAFGEIEDVNRFGFKAWRQYSVGVGLNTQIFGTAQFKRGFIRGLRHVVKPNVSLSFSPNYQDPSLGYFQTVRSETVEDEEEEYSIFRDGIFGGPPNSGQAMALSYSINNIFEAKYFSKKDSTAKKVKLFDNIVVGGNYNFAADSLKWSQVRASGTTRLFKGMTTLSAAATFDPYTVNENGKRIDVFERQVSGNFLRFVDANARFTTNLSVRKIRELFQGKEEEVIDDLNDREKDNPRPKETDFLSLFENFSISHNLIMRWDKNSEGRDTFRLTTNSINFRGSIELTDNWRLRIGSFGYDFNSEQITYPSFGVTRDLHCWQMDFNWAPQRGTYTFSIYVKPGSLDFIKIPYARNNADAARAFQ